MTAPRIWRGNTISVHHWKWDPELNSWDRPSDPRCLLWDGDIFVPAQAPRPTERPSGGLEECSSIDWLPTPHEPTNELTELRERVAELETAARAVGAAGKSPGTRTVLVDFDALIALEDLLPDQSGEADSDA